MIDYTTAKALKDAGFPQNGKSNLTAIGNVGAEFDEAYVPTLEELIETCGTFDLKIREEGTEVRKLHVGQWSSGLLKIKGSTPTEAVARLFLALNSGKIKNDGKSEKENE